MRASAVPGKHRDRLTRCSLSGSQYRVALRDKLHGDSTEEAQRTRCAIFLQRPPLGGDRRSLPGFAWGPLVSRRF